MPGFFELTIYSTAFKSTLIVNTKISHKVINHVIPFLTRSFYSKFQLRTFYYGYQNDK